MKILALAFCLVTANALAQPVPTPFQHGGKDAASPIPAFDPGSELVTWNGQHWHVTNQRLFSLEYEKYLSTPEASSTEDVAYHALMSKVQNLLSPANVSAATLDQAFHVLSEMADYQVDGNFSDVLSNQIYISWLALKSAGRITSAATALEAERKRLEWNLQMATTQPALGAGASNKTSKNGVFIPETPSLRQATLIEQIKTRLLEINTLLKSNQGKTEVSKTEARTDFQALLVQFYLQRRFEHVVIGVKFYRSIFNEGNSQLQVGEEAMSLLSKTTGNPPSLSTLDASAREMIQKVRQGVKAFGVLLAHQQMDNANKRLFESFSIGQYLPEIQLVPLSEKLKLLQYVQKTNQLISAIDVLDYALAAELVDSLRTSATDLDLTKPSAAIKTALVASDMHLAQARNAAVAGDKTTLETEMKTAAEIWPTNPKLAEMANAIFTQGNVQSKALVDFDQLVGQKNYRLISDDKLRFIAAVAAVPEKQEQLSKVLENIAQIDKALIQAGEIEKHGDFAGAWEVAETAFKEFPDDTKLNQIRANITVKAATFVNALSSARVLEDQRQFGSALAGYLQARKVYPDSQFAREGIDRVSREMIFDLQ